MSDSFGNTREYPSGGVSSDTPHYTLDNDQKCASIMDDHFDSGLGSLSITEEDNHRQLLEKIGMCQEELNPIDEEEITPKLSELQDVEESIPSCVYSLTEEDVMVAPYIPDGGLSSLHTAILDKDSEVATDLIQKCPDPACLNYFTTEIHTALHLAVYVNHPEIVRFLVVYGANINLKDSKGNTPLHTACELGRLWCIRMILSPLDDKEKIGLQEINLPQDINEKNYEGLTPLHLATMNDHPNVVSFLVQQSKINTNIGDSTSGRTALHHALERRNSECFYQLLKSSVNINATTYDGCSPLHLAVGLGLEPETRSLMTLGANVSMKTTDETRAWDLAQTERIKDALQYSTLQMKNFAVKQR